MGDWKTSPVGNNDFRRRSVGRGVRESTGVAGHVRRGARVEEPLAATVGDGRCREVVAAATGLQGHGLKRLLQGSRIPALVRSRRRRRGVVLGGVEDREPSVVGYGACRSRTRAGAEDARARVGDARAVTGLAAVREPGLEHAGELGVSREPRRSSRTRTAVDDDRATIGGLLDLLLLPAATVAAAVVGGGSGGRWRCSERLAGGEKRSLLSLARGVEETTFLEQ
jgi:hypothetical protein